MNYGMWDAKVFAERLKFAQLFAEFPSVLAIPEVDASVDVSATDEPALAATPFESSSEDSTNSSDAEDARLSAEDSAPTSPDSSSSFEKADVFAIRPLPDVLIRYCINDVIVLPMLYEHFLDHRFWNDVWAARVQAATEQRLEETRAEWWRWGHPDDVKPPQEWLEIEQVDRTAAIEEPVEGSNASAKEVDAFAQGADGSAETEGITEVDVATG